MSGAVNIGQDMFIRLSDPTGKHKEIINRHRVWDPQRFLKGMINSYSNGDNVRIVSIATEDEYLDHKRESK